MATITFTILGCGSSGGVPRIGGQWGDCDQDNPKNRRRRCSILIERQDAGCTTRVLIDSSPDLREQLLDAGISTLDAVVYTHSHADHIHGIDDLRVVTFNRRERLPVWADLPTQDRLLTAFNYVFVQPEGSTYPPILDLHTIEGDVSIEGAGGSITLVPFLVEHGAIDALGFRIGKVAYLPDVALMNEKAWDCVRDLDCWILDALRRTPHPTHTHLEQSLDWIERAAPKRAVLTNMHIDLDYETLDHETPDHITPAYDGMTISYEV